MSARPIEAIGRDTLLHLVSACLPTGELDVLLREVLELELSLAVMTKDLVNRVHVEPRVACQLEQRLESILGSFCSRPAAISCVDFKLQRASELCDGLVVAAILWRAARKPGLAWRRFEARADAALMAVALGQICTDMNHRKRTPSRCRACSPEDTLTVPVLLRMAK